jgi:hypothetical protein
MIGTEVELILNGATMRTRTESHGGLCGHGKSKFVGVFVAGIEEPVPVTQLRVDGGLICPGKAKR